MGTQGMGTKACRCEGWGTKRCHGREEHTEDDGGENRGWGGGKLTNDTMHKRHPPCTVGKVEARASDQGHNLVHANRGTNDRSTIYCIAHTQLLEDRWG